MDDNARIEESNNEKAIPAEQIEFSADEIESVRCAIRAAQQTMAKWNSESRVNPHKMMRLIGQGEI